MSAARDKNAASDNPGNSGPVGVGSAGDRSARVGSAGVRSAGVGSVGGDQSASHRELPLHEILRAHARRQPDKPAYLWYGAPVTYGELDRASDAFAARLAALGVAKGEPVALFMQNCPQYAIAHYGIQKLGAIVCPCGPMNKEHELQFSSRTWGRA